MTDVTSSSLGQAHVRRRRRAEFHVYFTLIFLLALPSETIGWARAVIRLRSLNLHGPLARAWREADRITPMIFSV